MRTHGVLASLPRVQPARTALRHSARAAFDGQRAQRLVRRLALTLLLATLPAVAEQAGRVIITAGSVQATTDAGGSRALARGDTVDVGDTISTDEAGQTQIRFIDGGLVSLRPNSEYHIDEFSFEPGQERHAATLRRGALSTLTGGAARKARERYRLSTPVATIGVRGTYYEVALARTGELYLGVSQGVIRATATNATASGTGFADLGVGEDYRFALFRPDGSFELLAARPALLEALSHVSRGRDGSARAPAGRGDAARSDGDGKDRDSANADKVRVDKEGGSREGGAGAADSLGDSRGDKFDDILGDALGGDLRKPGSGSFPALQPGDGAKPGTGILPGGLLDPGSNSGKGSGTAPPDSINPLKIPISPLERGDITPDALGSHIAART